MPIITQCPQSGALIFHLTEDEKEMKESIERSKAIEAENQRLKERLDKLENMLKTKK